VPIALRQDLLVYELNRVICPFGHRGYQIEQLFRFTHILKLVLLNQSSEEVSLIVRNELIAVPFVVVVDVTHNYLLVKVAIFPVYVLQDCLGITAISSINTHD